MPKVLRVAGITTQMPFAWDTPFCTKFIMVRVTWTPLLFKPSWFPLLLGRWVSLELNSTLVLASAALCKINAAHVFQHSPLCPGELNTSAEHKSLSMLVGCDRSGSEAQKATSLYSSFGYLSFQVLPVSFFFIRVSVSNTYLEVWTATTRKGRNML